jgi:hypothetical protein
MGYALRRNQINVSRTRTAYQFTGLVIARHAVPKPSGRSGGGIGVRLSRLKLVVRRMVGE